MKRFTTLLAAGSLAAAAALSGCTPDPGPSATATDTAASDTISEQTLNQRLHDKLPEHIKSSGILTTVNSGSFPPYTIIDGNSVSGATSEMAEALGQILGVRIEHKTVDSLSSVLAGMQAKRYDLDLGPAGDFVERQKQATFIDWAKEYVVFAVQKGNPKAINSIDTVCGKRIAVMSGGSAEKVVKEQSAKCSAAGNPAVEVQSYKDQPSSILAVQSGRADAFFSSRAPLTYFVKESKGQLELAGLDSSNGFGDLYQAAVVPIDSPMAEILLEAFKELKENGTYEAIMKKWGLEGNLIPEPGINLAKN